MSSDHDPTTRAGTDYVHNVGQFQEEVATVVREASDLDDAIRSLFRRGYGKLLICQGLKGYADGDSAGLKRRVIRVVNQLLRK